MQVFTPEQEAQIIKGIKSGDEAVFAEFHDISRPFFLGWLRKNFPKCPQAELDDVLQELYLKIWRKIDSFNYKSQFTTWAYHIAQNIMIDRFRQNKYHRECDSLDLAIECGAEFAAKDSEHESQIGIVNKVAELKNCLGQKHLAIFNMIYEEGRSFKFAAKKMKIPIGTVLSRSHYLKNKIKKQLNYGN